MTGSLFLRLIRTACLLIGMAALAAPVLAQGWQPLTGTPGSGGMVTPPSQPMPPSGTSPNPGVPQWTQPHPPQPVHPAPSPSSSGSCAAGITASPSIAQTGETVSLTVTIPAAFRSKIGRVTITGPEGAIYASGSGGVYRHWWEVPARFDSGDVPFTFEAVGRHADLYGQFPVLCSGSTRVSVGKALTVELSGPEAGLPGYQRSFGATAQGGKAPYRFAWTVDGTDAGTFTDDSTSRVGRTFTLKGEHIIAVTVTDAGNRQVSATKRHRAYELGINISGPTKLKVGETGSWTATTASPFGPYEFTFTWEDGSKTGPQETRAPNWSASHKYDRPRRYRITASVWDGKEQDFGELYVEVTDESDTVRVPDVRLKPVDDAVKEIKDLGLRVTVDWIPPDKPGKAHRVFTTKPRAGAPLKKGKTVAVTAYSEYRKLSVPKVVGMPLERAKKTLRDAHFKVVVPDVPRNPQAPRADLAGTVRKQVPEGGGKYPAGTEVELLVWGKRIAPDVSTDNWAGVWDCSRSTNVMHFSVPMELTISGAHTGSRLVGLHRRSANAGGDAGPYTYKIQGSGSGFSVTVHGTVTYREKPDKPIRFRGSFEIKIDSKSNMRLTHYFQGQDKPHTYSCKRK